MKMPPSSGVLPCPGWAGGAAPHAIASPRVHAARVKSNVKAGGGACPFRFRCLGCGHFRSDPSYLPELRDYLDTLLRDRERIRAATELDDWARTEAMPSDAEITRLRELIRRVEHDLDALDENDRRQIEEAVRVVRATRQTVHLGLPTTTAPALDSNLEGPA